MTIARGVIADYLNEQFSALADAVGQSSTPLTGYKPDIDGALRKLSKTESELATAIVEDANRDAYFALAEYHAARRFWRLLGANANVKVDDSTFDYKTVIANAKMLADDAQARCEALGYDVTGSGWGTLYLNQDWIEAETAEMA